MIVLYVLHIECQDCRSRESCNSIDWRAGLLLKEQHRDIKWSQDRRNDGVVRKAGLLGGEAGCCQGQEFAANNHGSRLSGEGSKQAKIRTALRKSAPTGHDSAEEQHVLQNNPISH